MENLQISGKKFISAMSAKTIPGVQQFRVPELHKSKARACVTCRERKRRCTLELPVCSYCHMRKKPCVYPSQTSPGPDKSAETPSEKPLEKPAETQAGTTTANKVPRALWPGSGAGSELQPEMRAGPVYTSILSPSLCLATGNVAPDLRLLRSYLPEKRDADTLIDRYQSAVHPVVPIFDLRSFHPHYELFWDNDKDASLEFYIVLLAILYAASVAEFEETSIDDHFGPHSDALVAQMKHYVAATEIALAMHGFPTRVALVDLQASFVLHYVLRSDCRTDDCGSVGYLVRLAQLLELQRDPWSYHRLQDASDVQQRRILWWQIYYLDCTTALSTRMPPIIVEGEHDTVFPAEYAKSGTGDFVLDAHVTFANRRFGWAVVCSRILRLAFRLQTPSDKDWFALHRDIDNLALQCSAATQRLLDNARTIHPDWLAFSTAVVASLADRCHVLVHLSLQRHPHRPETSSVSDAQLRTVGPEFEESQIHLLQQYLSYGSMPKNKRYLWEIRKFQPIQTILALLRSLIADVASLDRAAHSAEAIQALGASAKVRVLADAVQNLGYLADHTTPLCKQRWALVKELKHATWQQVFGRPQSTHDPGHSAASTQSDESLLSDEAWTQILTELGRVDQKIADSISVKVWDDDAGHYTL
ncbi:hypothetical protein KL921_004949 [Ogataea angusta]|nr:hypothetical protein KL921_004949 [Ogataea angusta]